MSSKRQLHFSIRIDAPVMKVWQTMLAPDTYRVWTSAFCEGSRYDGSWAQGERIVFLAPNGDGMVARIAANREHEFLSIEHLGWIKDGVEDTASEDVTSWAPAYENYAFREHDGMTEVSIEQDVTADFEQYMRDTWPKALESLAALCEGRARA